MQENVVLTMNCYIQGYVVVWFYLSPIPDSDTTVWIFDPNSQLLLRIPTPAAGVIRFHHPTPTATKPAIQLQLLTLTQASRAVPIRLSTPIPTIGNY